MSEPKHGPYEYMPDRHEIVEAGYDAVPLAENVSPADGPLFAAAPELYAACEKAASHHQGGHSEVGRILRAALAKARGEGEK